MSNYVLSCCSTVDLTAEQLRSRDISYICHHFSLDGKNYIDDLGRSMPFEDFYKAMANGAETRTSQVNVNEFTQYFTALMEQGKDVLHISMSSGLSGTFNSASIAAEEVRAKYPDRKLYVVDSLGGSSGCGLFLDMLADRRDAGMGIDELRDWAEENRLNIHHWFFSTDLTFLVKGGRISKASGWFGTVLQICPLLNVNNVGRLNLRQKIRGKARVIREIVVKMGEHAKDGLQYSGKCFISHSACYEDARAVADLVEARFPNLKGKVRINSIGTTMGSHSGPGAVALFFYGDKRVD